MIDAGQKQTLANILLNRTTVSREEVTNKEAEIAGDEELVELVKRWGDPRLVGFLMNQLRANASDPYPASRTMTMIAELLSNKDVEKLAEKYSEIAYEDNDSEAVDQAADAAGEEAAPEASEKEPLMKPETEESAPVVDVQVLAADPGEPKDENLRK